MSLYSKDIDYVPFQSTGAEGETLEPKRGGEKCRFMNQSWVLECRWSVRAAGDRERPGRAVGTALLPYLHASPTFK